MRLPISLLYLALSILPRTTLAVFRDEAYHVDYQHQLLGLPLPQTTFFYRPRSNEKASLLYTLSDLGVLGAVNPATGEIVWRQWLARHSESGPGHLRPVEGETTVVSAIGNRVDAWDAASGKERWGNVFFGAVKDLEVMETASETKDILALFEEHGKGLLRRLSGTNGDVAWEYKDGSNDVPLQVCTNIGSVFIVSLHGTWGGYSVKVATLDPVTGKKTTEYTLPTTGDVHSPADVLLVGGNSASPIVAWTDKAMKALKVNILGKSGDIKILPLKEADGAIRNVTLHAPQLVQSLPHFLVHSKSAVANRADVYHIDLKSGSIKLAYELPKLPGHGAISTASLDANVHFTRITEDEVILVSSESHAILGRWKTTLDTLIHGVSEVVKKAADSYAVRSAVVTTHDDWVLVRNGEKGWSRPEGLSGVVDAEWAEISESESLAKTLEAEAHSNPLSAYIHRVKRHANDLQHLPEYLLALPKRLLSSILPDATWSNPGVLVRDSFGFNKLVVLATQRGRLYGIDAGNHGEVVWSMQAFEIPDGKKWNVIGIWVQSSRGLTTVRGSEGEHIIVKTATGEKVEKMDPGSEQHTTSAVVVESVSEQRFLPIGIDGQPGEVPSAWAPKDIVVVQGANGEIKGLKFSPKGLIAESSVHWTFQPGPRQRITNVTTRPAHDPVASIGTVLGDRTVLYKYLNPNILLVTAVSDESSIASFYLLDSVSGDILYSATHEGVDTSQPIASTLSENWFAYSLWADALTSATALPGSKGYQLVVSELFESAIANVRGPLGNAGNSSSLQPSEIPNIEPALPHVVTQAFLVPEQITQMSVTQTRQGITTRQLLCTLASNAIVGIPRNVLNPRRIVGRDPVASEMEEGLFRYQPLIDFDPKMILTHKREVIGVKKVITSPALLESTSLLFAYGIDIFGTRVTPSAAFDILGKGFNKLSLVATVLALAIGVAIMAPLVRRKQINGRWLAS